MSPLISEQQTYHDGETPTLSMLRSRSRSTVRGFSHTRDGLIEDHPATGDVKQEIQQQHPWAIRSHVSTENIQDSSCQTKIRPYDLYNRITA